MLNDDLTFAGTFLAGYPDMEDWSLPAGLGIYNGNVAVIDVVMQGLFTYDPRIVPPVAVGKGDNLGSQPNQIIVDGDYGYVILSGTDDVKVIDLAAPSTALGNGRMVTNIPARINSGTEKTNPTFGAMLGEKLYVSLTGITGQEGGNQLLEIAPREIDTGVPPATAQALATRALTFSADDLEKDDGAPSNYPSPAGVATASGTIYVALGNLGVVAGIPIPVGPGYLAKVDPVTWTKTLYRMPDECRNPRHLLATADRIYVACPGLYGQGTPTEALVVLDAATMSPIRVTTFPRCGPSDPVDGPDACFTASPGRMTLAGDRLVIADEMSGRLFVTDLDGNVPEGMTAGIKVCELECYTPTWCTQSILDVISIP